MSKMILRKGGLLFEFTWNGEQQCYDETDVTEHAISRLFHVCEFEDGVTLRDILLLINHEADLFDLVLMNWTKDIVDEGLSNSPLRSGPESVEFLELFWDMCDDGDVAQTPASFHGWGEWSHDGYSPYPEGHKGGIAIEFTPIYDIVDCEVKLNTNFGISDGKTDSHPTYKTRSFTLGEILYGIMWELSFCGSPSDRDEARAHIEAVVTDIRDEIADLIPLDMEGERDK